MLILQPWHLLLLVLACVPLIAAIISILRSSRSTVAKVVWLLVVAAFPILGTLVWFCYGWQRRLRCFPVG
jgi:hypothetical protein